MRLLVCGGRNFDDQSFVFSALDRVHAERPITVLISGNAPGADTLAERWAHETNIPIETFPAEWSVYGKVAGKVRNEEMLVRGKPNEVLAFPGGTGTADMVRRAEKASVPTFAYEWLYFRKEDPDSWFLSNFAEGFEFQDRDGNHWLTSEHYYQAQKVVDNPVVWKAVKNAPTPAETKKIAREFAPSPYRWNERKEDVMIEALAYKFRAGSEAANKLIATGPTKYLVEYTTWGDTYWGVDTNLQGKNRLGKLLMERRNILVEETLFGFYA
jgi:ribA/ribD-fused uncharacterized protein